MIYPFLLTHILDVFICMNLKQNVPLLLIPIYSLLALFVYVLSRCKPPRPACAGLDRHETAAGSPRICCAAGKKVGGGCAETGAWQLSVISATGLSNRAMFKRSVEGGVYALPASTLRHNLLFNNRFCRYSDNSLSLPVFSSPLYTLEGACSLATFPQ